MATQAQGNVPAELIRTLTTAVVQELALQREVAPPVDEIEGATASKPQGRPKKGINMDYVCELLFELHMPLTKVAAMCGVDRHTLYRRLKDEGIDTSKGSRYTDLTDQQLEEHVRIIKREHPNAGLVYLTGHLRSRGIFVQRQRVINSLQAVDPDGVEERLNVAIARREYCVPCPNFMWHLDGHHKLVNWKLVIHACVDGFSRTIIFLNCADNNRAETPHRLFCDATLYYGWPIKVRTDYGGENVKVWDEMLAHRRQERSVIAGSSVHNTRVERMHLEVKTQVVTTFKAIFLDFERGGILDRDNDTDLFCLHYVFLPRINRALQEFRQGHNNHSLRTERNQTPLQLFFTNSHLIPQYEEDETDHDDGPGLTVRELRESECQLPFVPVDSVRCPLTDAELVQLQQQFDSLASDNARQTYLDVAQFVSECLSNP